MRTIFHFLLIAFTLFLGSVRALDNVWPTLPTITDAEIASYIMPQDHKTFSTLQKLFRKPHVLDNEESFTSAGFEILHKRPSTLIVAAHPRLPGYLLKVHLRNSKRNWHEIWENCANRCKGAENLRNLIRENNIKYFKVVKKWIYLPPIENTPPVLVVTRANVVSKEESVYAWKNNITHKHLDELYCIIRSGFASTSLPSNAPYSRKGIFIFLDTECPMRIPLYDHAKAHLSEEMQVYWDQLVQTGK